MWLFINKIYKNLLLSVLVDALYTPTLHRLNSTLSFHNSSTGEDLYAYSIGRLGHQSNNTWSNQKDFDLLDLTLEATFDANGIIGSLPEFPNYISGVTFGIVLGQVLLSHTSTASGTKIRINHGFFVIIVPLMVVLSITVIFITRTNI